MKEENKMTNTNEIMNNWKEYTNANNVKEWYELNDLDGTGYDTETEIQYFCEEYNYNYDVYDYLYKSF